MRVPFLLIVVAASLLAGCLQAGHPAADTHPERRVVHAPPPNLDTAAINTTLSQPRFDPAKLIHEDYWHTSWDGTILHSRIYRPGDAGAWKSPIILHMSPYFGQNSAQNVPTGNGLDGWLVSYFVPRGYAIVLNDVRGTGESGGCLEQTGPKQTKDGYTVVEELAQLPWASGRVGMIGISYDGETQQSTATAHPPHLTTVVPVESVAGQYEWNFYDGVPYTTNGALGMASYAEIGLQPNTPSTFLTGGGSSGPAPTMYAERFGCHSENLKEGIDPRGDFDQYWKDREIRLHVNDIGNTSFLYVHGLEDWNVKPNMIRDWFNLIPSTKHAWIGQWQHNFPDRNTFKAEWSRSDWRYTVERWFDYWLLDLPTGIMDEPAVQVMDSTGRWRYEDAWPPAPSEVLRLYPDPAQKLGLLPSREGTLQYTDNTLSMEGNGPSVSFVTEPLASTLHYAGWPTLNFTAILGGAPTAMGTHFAVHLIDVADDGTERIINRGYLDAQHRESLERSVPVPQGTPIQYHLRLFPQDDVVPAGHRLKIKIGAVDGWIQPDGTQAQVTLQLGGEKSYLDLPLIDETHARFFTPVKFEN